MIVGRVLFCWLALLWGVMANFELTLDKSTYAATSDSITVSWTDDGKSPKVSKFKSATFLLCTYQSPGNMKCPIKVKKDVDISSASKETFPLASFVSDGGSGSYVLQMAASITDDQYVIVYSDWFKLTGMTGSEKALQGNTGDEVHGIDSGGAGQYSAKSHAIPSSYMNLPSPWMTPYKYQFGATRYAPFQSTPGSTITAKLTATRRFPTSSYSAFTTVMITPIPVTTLIPSPSVTPSQYPHYGSTVDVTESGVKPTRVTPTALVRRRRWVD